MCYWKGKRISFYCFVSLISKMTKVWGELVAGLVELQKRETVMRSVGKNQCSYEKWGIWGKRSRTREKPGEQLWSWLAGSATAASPGNVTETQTLGLIPSGWYGDPYRLSTTFHGVLERNIHLGLGFSKEQVSNIFVIDPQASYCHTFCFT